MKLPDGTIEQRQAIELSAQFDLQIQSWDMAFKDTKKADFVVWQVHAALGADRFLLDQVRASSGMHSIAESRFLRWSSAAPSGGGSSKPLRHEGTKLSEPSFSRELLVEREIQLEHVDARFAEQAQVRRFRKLSDQLVHLI